MDQALNDTGWRGSQEGWLEAAYHSLLDSGVDSVKILPLAKKLNLSRTSFYWFFKDREELLAGLVARWRDKNTGNIIKQSEAYAESLAEAMLNVFDCWLNNELFDARFEFAVRSWALQSDEILAEVRQADQLRLEALKLMFIRFGLPEATSDVRARTTYLVQIGYISMQAREELAVRMKRIPEYIAIYTGEVPQQRELDRFFSRHGYRPG
ncbi:MULTISPECIES: TetR/AcrR family transcriptional regulator [Rhizobium]|uniref:TetR/AcrR family transcriptional regulator n=1 Tax=Rhizobium TaxID=379 RepID=UPI000FEC3C92|nr:TetR/AcrR family transcriptional regulator [Rhizobium leguminosarum]TCA34793.1 TetR/AcrR family transcriptional regulator [Rhizobium leguminosarum bv. viciae]MBY2910983.1 TetR/AcrR family transcriptional regulator [Rhizobium leguminosarum]MBY2915401.1 TetR/AcrR family transcriptional regulator [Rhizobium leguminosarum]MBY2924602.1 TetR/AcrR family transcriptional regulator [Rhizobium leguminosarum]MBY2937095.1 TetR/AcrR family transcriptional regulator [Rhizobium leguminosarum]